VIVRRYKELHGWWWFFQSSLACRRSSEVVEAFRGYFLPGFDIDSYGIFFSDVLGTA
jgi:hypothetical protein